MVWLGVRGNIARQNCCLVLVAGKPIVLLSIVTQLFDQLTVTGLVCRYKILLLVARSVQITVG